THSPRPVDFAGVVLNYRTPDQAALAAASLRASRTPPSEILIVDNHSGDGSAAMLRQSFPEARVIESGDNLGFSGGCNLGIRAALEGRREFILLLNSDAVLAPDSIDYLIGAMEKDPSLGVAAPVL